MGLCFLPELAGAWKAAPRLRSEPVPGVHTARLNYFPAHGWDRSEKYIRQSMADRLGIIKIAAHHLQQAIAPIPPPHTKNPNQPQPDDFSKLRAWNHPQHDEKAMSREVQRRIGIVYPYCPILSLSITHGPRTYHRGVRNTLYKRSLFCESGRLCSQDSYWTQHEGCR